jgi:predicted HTH transcriptional regulator
MRLVKTGPGLAEKLQRKRVVGRLREFRERLEADMLPEPIGALNVSAVVLLSDVCEALGLDEGETAQVLGCGGAAALACEMAAVEGVINRRQIQALDIVRKHGSVTLGTYRAVCPGWSDETLRLDLADLVARGLLVKNGAKKGTSYTLPI